MMQGACGAAECVGLVWQLGKIVPFLPVDVVLVKFYVGKNLRLIKYLMVFCCGGLGFFLCKVKMAVFSRFSCKKVTRLHGAALVSASAAAVVECRLK